MNLESLFTAVAFVTGSVVNAATFAYFYGRLAQRVDDHARRLDRLEARADKES